MYKKSVILKSNPDAVKHPNGISYPQAPQACLSLHVPGSHYNHSISGDSSAYKEHNHPKSRIEDNKAMPQRRVGGEMSKICPLQNTILVKSSTNASM